MWRKLIFNWILRIFNAGSCWWSWRHFTQQHSSVRDKLHGKTHFHRSVLKQNLHSLPFVIHLRGVPKVTWIIDELMLKTTIDNDSKNTIRWSACDLDIEACSDFVLSVLLLTLEYVLKCGLLLGAVHERHRTWQRRWRQLVSFFWCRIFRGRRRRAETSDELENLISKNGNIDQNANGEIAGNTVKWCHLKIFPGNDKMFDWNYQ